MKVPAIGNSKRPKIFGPRQIAKLLHQCHGKADLAAMQAEDKDGFSTNSERQFDLGMEGVSNKEAIGAYKIFSKFI
jgi:hypothetical protein